MCGKYYIHSFERGGSVVGGVGERERERERVRVGMGSG